MTQLNADVASLLSTLHSMDIQLQVEGNRLTLNAPKGAVTTELRQRIKQHKADIIRFHQHNNSNMAARIPALSRQDPMPCSFAQQRLWLLDKLEPGSYTYNIPIFLRVKGELQLTVLQAALNEIVSRHESLRTIFRESDDEINEPQQWILPQLNIAALLTDLSKLPENEAEARLREQAIREVETPFNLAQGPLLRLHVIKVAAHHHVLLLTLHHIIFDGLSLDILLKELSTLYTAFSTQQPSPLADLTIHYADYSSWQRNRMTGVYLQEHLSFWRKQLEGAPPLLGLPTDHPRPALQSYAGARQTFETSTETTQKFRELSQQNGATLFMAFHAVLAILLARYTGKDDIVIGAPVANRNQHQLEALIGFFTNTMVLRSEVRPDNSFNDLLSQVKKQALQAYKYQELPFEKLVDELKIERSMSHNPLFQVLFSFQNAHTEGFSLPHVDIAPLAFDYTVSKFDLSFIVREHQNKFTVILEYSTALFDAATIQRMMGHFHALMDTIVEQPDTPLGQLSMLTQQDVQQLQAWNQTTTDFPLDKTLVELFEAQVVRTPDQIALVFARESLTYHQLNTQANQLAYYLLQNTTCQAQHNPLVALCVERSTDMMISLLGTLKAGAAYVPVDPSYPEARIRHMLTDSEATVILTQSHLQGSLPLDSDGITRQILCLDTGIFAGYPTTNPPPQSRSGDLAYVIYTSGSTGNPKGVMIEHRSLSNLLQDMQQRTGINVDDRLLAVTTLSFDIAALELYLPLISGSCLCLTDKATNSDAHALQQQLEAQKISFMQATPSTWQLLRHSNWQAKPPLNILCGGEPLPAELVGYLLENSTKLWNVYGPTETTIWSATCHIQKNQNAYTAIGQPLANTQIHILDAQHNIQPIGIPGELCIMGAGLARGYLHHAKLTAEKFVTTDIFGRAERLYKTGDLARWLPNGNLECLGRLDHQVKIRGFRIELGEIETLLTQYPKVREAIVISPLTASGDKQLVAYVLILEQTEGDSNDVVGRLKADLQGKLPDYMIPAFFVLLDEFPLLPNGKINRQALPEPNHFNTRHKGADYMHPRNSLELQLSQLWESTLNCSPISVFDNFFDIGGDSLRAIRLMTLINQQFSVKIPLNSLFQSGTIEQMACLLRRDTQIDTQNSPLVALQTHGTNAPIFCVHAAGGIVFRYQQVAKRLSKYYDHPFFGLQAKGIEPGEIPYPSIEDMAQHYVAAIRQAKPQGPYLLAGWSMGGTVAFEMARLLEGMDEIVSGVLMIDAPSPYMDAYEADDIDFLLERLEPAAGINIQEVVEQQASEQAKKQLILEQKKQLGLFPPDIQLVEAEQRLAVHKHHNRLLCQYQPSAVINAGIAFIRATEETSFDEKMKDPVPAWAEFTRKGIVEQESPGNHFNMFSNAYSPILAGKLRLCIKDLGV